MNGIQYLKDVVAWYMASFLIIGMSYIVTLIPDEWVGVITHYPGIIVFYLTELFGIMVLILLVLPWFFAYEDYRRKKVNGI